MGTLKLYRTAHCVAPHLVPLITCVIERIYCTAGESSNCIISLTLLFVHQSLRSARRVEMLRISHN